MHGSGRGSHGVVDQTPPPKPQNPIPQDTVLMSVCLVYDPIPRTPHPILCQPPKTQDKPQPPNLAPQETVPKSVCSQLLGVYVWRAVQGAGTGLGETVLLGSVVLHHRLLFHAPHLRPHTRSNAKTQLLQGCLAHKKAPPS